LQSPRSLTPDQIKAALGEDQTESNEETYDIYLLPPGEDPEACQSYLRMRNREGKYNLMFEVFCLMSPDYVLYTCGGYLFIVLLQLNIIACHDSSCYPFSLAKLLPYSIYLYILGIFSLLEH
jgi:hypothetical protein